ncbi:pentapeptide repeat-containing protein [Roseovarius sp. ZX-A-9]|uniref:pentapeptide repeat-containing protein n=1 Tax=Roseovarius sp. ZX-A-9 TaxID=3014783 RepID=UPI00232EF8CE|nr:pentapeptide repeat-containing protein [Roseovarius sp. ZX-A-9]
MRADVFALIVGTCVFVGLCGLVYFATNRGNKPDEITVLPRLHKRPALNLIGLFAIPFSFLWAALLILTITSLFNLWFDPPEPTAKDALAYRVHFLAIVGLMTALAGLIGAPLALIRVFTTERQTTAAEEGLITDRITRAVEGLGAEKVVKVVNETPRYRIDARGEWLRDDDGNPIPATHPDGTPIIDRSSIETTAPNLEVRIGAIYALERIAQDSDRDHVQIMEILCAYIRQNAPASDAVEWPEIEMHEDERDGPLHDDWKERVKAFEAKQRALKADLTCRDDIQTALTVIGRRSEHQRALEALAGHEDRNAKFVFDTPCPELPEPDEDGRYDPAAMKSFQAEMKTWNAALRDYPGDRLDLRRCNLQGSDMSKADFGGARMDDSQMQGAFLKKSKMQGADLSYAQMQGADLKGAKMQGAGLWGAKMQGADLWGAKMQGAKLSSARMQGAALGGAEMQGADLRIAEMQGAIFWGARMQGAKLRGAMMQGANLMEAMFDSGTSFDDVILRGAALKAVDCANLPSLLAHAADFFADASVETPVGFDRPDHWPQFVIDLPEFREHWRKWLANPNSYTPPSPPDSTPG